MFHLPPSIFRKNTGLIIFLLCFLVTLLGTFNTVGDFVYRWGANTEPNAFGSKWILWAMLLLTLSSLFTSSSFMKPKLGQSTVSEETACALTIGLMTIFTSINIIVVIYSYFPISNIPIIGIILTFIALILYILITVSKNKNR